MIEIIFDFILDSFIFMLRFVFEMVISLSAIEIISIIKEGLTIVAILMGVIFGYKGIRRYLIEDIIKTKTKKLNEANHEAFKLTEQIMVEIREQRKNIQRPVEESDIKSVQQTTKQLVNETIGSSSEVHTLAFYLKETIQDISPTTFKKYKMERRDARDFFFLVHDTCDEIRLFANKIVEIPKKKKSRKLYGINPRVWKNLNHKYSKSIRNFYYGPNLNPNSPIALAFFNTLRRANAKYVFFKNYFSFLEDNAPIIHHLHERQIYIPVVLISKQESPLGPKYLHLVKYKPINYDNGERTILFTYSNIITFFNFMDDFHRNNKSITENFYDNYLGQEILTDHFPTKYTKETEESVSIECKLKDVQDYYKEVKKPFKKRVKNLKHKYK